MAQALPDTPVHDTASERHLLNRVADLAPGIAVAAIWVATLFFSLFAPDMVSGSAQEHLPIAGITAWLWAAAATGYVLVAARGRDRGQDRGDDPGPWLGFELSIVAIWVVVALAGIFAPEMVTGTDPTRIPIAAIVAPVAGMVATGFAALHVATRR